MKLTGRTMMLEHYSTDACIAKLKELGFDGIELCFIQHDFQFRPDMIEPFFAAHTVETCKRLGMPIESMSYHGDYIFSEQTYQNIQKAIAATPMYGTNICIIAGAAKRIDHDPQTDWDLFVSHMKVLLAIAAQHGVYLAMEYEPGMVCGTTAEFFQLIADLQSDELAAHLKVNLDVGHTFLCEPDPMAAIASLAGYIVHGHVENMRRGVHRHLPPHIGDMVVGDYLKAAADAGFDGAFALDLYQDDYTEVSPAALAFLRGEMVQRGIK